MKRVYYEELLARDGVLFVHDADRPHLYEGFQMFGSYHFIRGTNIRTNGESQYIRAGAILPILGSGETISNITFCADRELFFFYNKKGMNLSG
jgi:hypothetical protein